MFLFLANGHPSPNNIFFLAEKARNLYPSEIGNFAESPRFFVNVCSLKEQSIIIIVDARVLSPSGGYAKLKFFQALLGLDIQNCIKQLSHLKILYKVWDHFLGN